MSSPIVVLLNSWPQPSTSPEPIVFATDTMLFLRYGTDDEKTAVIQFPLVKKFQFGSPNDEALGGHPLTAFGLRQYQVHRIDNSPWIGELERQNSIHPRHDRKHFLSDLVHYVFTFQDSTLECVVNEGQFWLPKIQVLASYEEIKEAWHRLITGTAP